MTAEEFLKEHGIPNMPTQYSLQFQTDVKDTVKALEAYANQKVLEALKSEKEYRKSGRMDISFIEWLLEKRILTKL